MMLRGLVIVFIAGLTLNGCGDSEVETGEKAGLADSKTVVAYVNGKPVHEIDVDLAFDRTLGSQAAVFADENAWNKVLESVVSSRVIAGLAEQEMNDLERQELNARANAWRDEQLVKRYLSDKVNPEPVTSSMVEDYYNRHPELFGGSERWHYESLGIAIRGDESHRDRALSFLGNASEKEDWKELASEARNDQLQVIYQRSEVAQGLGKPALQARLKSLQPGKTSALSIEDGNANVVRLLRHEMLPPKPLHEVSDEIRMRLAPVKLRKAIRKVMEETIQDADIQYVKAKQ